MISKTIGFRGTRHFQTHPHDGNAESISHSIDSKMMFLRFVFFHWFLFVSPDINSNSRQRLIGFGNGLELLLRPGLLVHILSWKPWRRAGVLRHVFCRRNAGGRNIVRVSMCMYMYEDCIYSVYIYNYIYILSYTYRHLKESRMNNSMCIYTSEAESWNIKYHEDGALCQNEAVDASLAVNQHGSNGPGSKREHVLALRPYFRLKTMKFLTCLVFLPGWIAGKNNNKQKVEHIAALFPNKQQSWLSPRCVYTVMLGNRQKKNVAPKVHWTA